MTKNELLERAKPILFNTEMVRAIQDGRKTVTRRLIKVVPETAHMFLGINSATQKAEFLFGEIRNGVCFDWEVDVKLPFRIGDVLYVRETWCIQYCWECDQNGYADDCDIESADFDFSIAPFGEQGCYIYYAENDTYKPMHGWKPAIHMPKEAARIFLRVTGVRVEQLQDITPEDIIKEGFCEVFPAGIWQADFYNTWNSTIRPADLAKYGWNANPWVWVIEFERVEVTK